MPINPRTYTVERFELDTNAQGVDVETLTATFTVSGNLQQMRPAEVQNMPSDFRDKPGAKFAFFTLPGVDMRTGGTRQGDATLYSPDRLVRSDGTVLYVHGLTDRGDGLRPHKKWFLYAPQTEIGRGATP